MKLTDEQKRIMEEHTASILGMFLGGLALFVLLYGLPDLLAWLGVEIK